MKQHMNATQFGNFVEESIDRVNKQNEDLKKVVKAYGENPFDTAKE
jgi:ketol-acid reductoisomerase|tara:strand:+ start:40 stop:177 length:138 start_codon:yes stop_codon:yes gene_type:complete